MIADADKLKATVTLLAEVQRALDGGWYYSSPLVREGVFENPAIIQESPGAIGIVRMVAEDVNALATYLLTLQERAVALGIDTCAICGANLSRLAGVHLRLAEELALVVSNAEGDLAPIEATAVPERKRRGRAKPSTQLEITPETPAETE